MRKNVYLLSLVSIWCCGVAHADFADLIHRWSFNGDYSDSVGGEPVDPNGLATITDGALDLTANDGVAFPQPPASWATFSEGIRNTVQGLDKLSIELWMKVETYGNNHRAFVFGNNFDDAIQLIPEQFGGFRMFIQDNSSTGGAMWSNSLPQPPFDTWFHVVCVIDFPNNTHGLYIDGGLIETNKSVAVGPGAIDVADIPMNQAYLGRNETGTTAPLDGLIDEFRIYNDCLTEDEIALHFAFGPNASNPDPNIPVSLKHRYSFNGASVDDPNSLMDSVGGFHAVNEGKAAIDPNGSPTGGGVLDLSLNVGGNENSSNVSWVDLPIDATFPSLTNATVEIWLKPIEHHNNARVWEAGEFWGEGFNLIPDHFGQTKCLLQISQGADIANMGQGDPNLVPLNEWSYVACVKDEDNERLKIYYNGVLMDDVSSLRKISGVTINEVFLGRHVQIGGGTATWPGYIDEFRVWCEALSNVQIFSNFKCGPDNLNCEVLPINCFEALLLHPEFAEPMDFNNDCYVNNGDFALFAEAFLNCIDPAEETCDHPWEP